MRVGILALFLALFLATAVFITFALPTSVARGQTGLGATQSSASEQSSSIRGVVLNANTNQPIGRALVQVQGHGMLTGSDGHFEFSGLSGTTASVQVKKPGFYDGVDPYMMATRNLAVGSQEDAQIRLYPEALITGTLTTEEGDPLPRLSVQAMRRVNDESGARWVQGGQTLTNNDGEFRLPLPGGEYVVETQYMQERPGSRGAILPLVFPAPGAAGGTGGGQQDDVSMIRMTSGTEEYLELHPAVRPSHAVHIHIDSVDTSIDGVSRAGTAGRGPDRTASGSRVQEQRGSQLIQAHLSNGLVFSPAIRDTDPTGAAVVDLPNGSYMLSASTGNQNEGQSYGETHVTVAGEDVTGVEIHMQKALDLVVEASLDPTSDVTTALSSSTESRGTTAATDPSALMVRQLGLFLQRTDQALSMTGDLIYPSAHNGGTLSLSLLPGRYRLRTNSYGQLFVQSANVGGTDLLAETLAVDGSSALSPLRLVVSTKTATVKGMVKSGDQPAASYVYLIATGPSSAPVVRARSGEDGAFAKNSVPTGSYRVVACDSRINFDLTDPAIQKQFGARMKTVTVAPGETGNVDLEVIPVSELNP